MSNFDWGRRTVLLVGLCLFMGQSFASSRALFTEFEKPVTDAKCRARLENLEGVRHVFTIAGMEPMASQQKFPEAAIPRFAHWSPDLLVKAILEIDQDYSAVCPLTDGLKELSLGLKRAYFAKLELKGPVGTLSKENTEVLFHGLMVLKSDFSELQTQIASLPAVETPFSFIEKVYGVPAELVDGVLVLTGNATARQNLAKQLDELCGSEKPCTFWDPRWVLRVILVTKPGIAVSFPEVGVLLLSESLFTEPSQIHKLVWLHELAHMATRAALVTTGEDWVKTFSAFSGWKKEKGKWSAPVQSIGTFQDALSKAAPSSAFPLGPDTVYSSKSPKARALDGFVFAKSYSESAKHNDPGEDLADHIAAFQYAPFRFCYKNEPLAPQKFRWVASHVFHSDRKLHCNQKK